MLLAVLLLSVSGFLIRLLEYRAAANEYAQIAMQMNGAESQTATPSLTPEKSEAPSFPVCTAVPAATPIVYFSREMILLKAQNSDTVGYLSIDGTAIQYPVVHGNDNSYYENHTFLKKKNASGAIFMDSTNASDLSDFNLVLYGHHMKDGSMFHDLLNYRKASFAKEHREIVLTGLFEQKTFYVFSAYTCSQIIDVRGFQYTEAQERQTFLNVLLKRSIISAGSFQPTSDDQIITLVTCRENANKDYFVVHGVLGD